MDMIRTRQLKYLETNEDEIQIRIYGGAAIVTGIAITKVMLDGEERQRRTKRFTEIYVLEDLQLRLAARQAKLIEANKSLSRMHRRASENPLKIGVMHLSRRRNERFGTN